MFGKVIYSSLLSKQATTRPRANIDSPNKIITERYNHKMFKIKPSADDILALRPLVDNLDPVQNM